MSHNATGTTRKALQNLPWLIVAILAINAVINNYEGQKELNQELDVVGCEGGALDPTARLHEAQLFANWWNLVSFSHEGGQAEEFYEFDDGLHQSEFGRWQPARPYNKEGQAIQVCVSYDSHGTTVVLTK